MIGMSPSPGSKAVIGTSERTQPDPAPHIHSGLSISL